jgi:hypothetical protein
MGFFCHSPMNKIVGAITVHKKNHFVVLHVSNQLQSLGHLKT